MGASPGVAWVTGGAGVLGRYVCRSLADGGWSVTSLGRSPWPEAGTWGASRHVEADVAPAALERIAELSGLPDVVFHSAGSGTVSAAYESPHEAFYDTVVTAETVLEYLRIEAPEAHFIYPSSAAVYGAVPSSALPIKEDARLEPVSPYGTHKLIVEQLCRSRAETFGMRCTVVRFFSLYGPLMTKQVLWDVAKKATSSKEGDRVALFGTGDETRDFLHLQDAARLVALVAAQGGQTQLQTLNGASGVAVSIRSVVERLADALGMSVRVEFTGNDRPGDPSRYEADVTRARALGFDPEYDLDRGLRDFARWYLSDSQAAAS